MASKGQITAIQVDLEDLETELTMLRCHRESQEHAWLTGVTIPNYHAERDHLSDEHKRITSEIRRLQQKLERLILEA
jgi:ABC-type phosphate transport system auxiliary subunit